MQLQALLMVPVRGTVYIVKLPFVYVWRVVYYLYLCLYAVFASILRLPVFYAKKVYNRLVFTWGWTKLSARHSLGLSRTPAVTDGTQTLHPNDYLSEPVPGQAAPYGLPLTEQDDPYTRSPYGPYKRSGHGGQRNKRERKAMITHLLRLLLEPSSPVESDDETERAISARPAEHDEAEKALNLILDLVKLSKQDPTARDHSRAAPSLKPGELEALLRQAKDREHLQVLITEVDQLAIDVDPTRRNGVLSGHPSPSHMPFDSERPSSSGSMELCYTSTNPSSIVSSSDEYMEPADDEELEESPDRHSYNYDGLSPVPESPEYLTASSESLRMNQLDDELTRALSNLTTAANGLNADQEMVESMETQITQKTVTVTESVDVQENDLESVPKTTPLLGVQVGHEKRQLGNARKSRPPSRRPQSNKDSPTTDQQSDNTIQGDLDGGGSSESDDDVIEAPKGESPRVKPSGGVCILPPLQLTDQIQLLTSGSTNWPTNQNPPEDDDADEPSSEQPGSKVEGESPSRRDSASSDTEKMKIPSNQPPWIEMVLRRRSSSSTSSTHTTVDSPVVVYTPPPRKTRVHSNPQSDHSPPQDIETNNDNLWDRDPTLDVTTGLYDTLQPKPKPTETVYLHERIAAHHGASSVEPSPRLPPRNSLGLERTTSAETVTKPLSDRALQRRASEKHSPSTRESRRDKESRESSKERHDRSKESHSRKSKESSRDKSTRESRSKDKETRQSRSREKESHERHRSGHRSHSAERSEHRHSSDSHRHRSRSGDRSSSQSTERHSSSHRHSSSERHSSSHRHSSSDGHRSSSRDKQSSAASSSASKPSKDGDAKFKLLSSPHSSKSRLATALFSRSSSKDKNDKLKKTSSQKEEKGKKSSKSEGSKKKTPARSSKQRGSTSSEGSPDTEGMPRSTSSTSIRSAGAASAYSFDSVISGKNTDV